MQTADPQAAEELHARGDALKWNGRIVDRLVSLTVFTKISADSTFTVQWPDMKTFFDVFFFE